jgi:hypothetical protein
VLMYWNRSLSKKWKALKDGPEREPESSAA